MGWGGQAAVLLSAWQGALWGRCVCPGEPRPSGASTATRWTAARVRHPHTHMRTHPHTHAHTHLQTYWDDQMQLLLCYICVPWIEPCIQWFYLIITCHSADASIQRVLHTPQYRRHAWATATWPAGRKDLNTSPLFFSSPPQMEREKRGMSRWTSAGLSQTACWRRCVRACVCVVYICVSTMNDLWTAFCSQISFEKWMSVSLRVADKQSRRDGRVQSLSETSTHSLCLHKKYDSSLRLFII